MAYESRTILTKIVKSSNPMTAFLESVYSSLNIHTHTHTHTHTHVHIYTHKDIWTSLVTQMVKNLPAMQETQVQSLDWEDPLEKEMATHSVFLPGEFHGHRSPAGYSP